MPRSALFLELNNLMARHGFRPRKKMGQHFIVREDVIEEAVKQAELKKSDTVLEVGAGTGFLTRALAKQAKVIAVEKDETLCALLRLEHGKDKNIAILEGAFPEIEVPAYNKVVSFPPYYLSKRLARFLLSHSFERMVLLLQEEFASKLEAEPGFVEFNALSVITQYFAEVQRGKRVRPSAFFPQPKGDSVIIVLSRRPFKPQVKSEEKFCRFVEELFRLKNKNMSNALKRALMNMGKKKSEAASLCDKAKKAGFGGKKVALHEVEEFVDIFNLLFGGLSRRSKI